MDKRFFPLPEVIVDGDVQVAEGTGSMNNAQKVMRVPLGNTPADRHVRAHEMAHAKYSPESPMAPANIHKHAIQRAEDMRMNYYCRAVGLDEEMDAPIIPTREMMDQLCADELGAVTAASSCWNTGDWPMAVAAIGETHGPEFLDRVAEFIPGLWNFLDIQGEPNWDDTLRNAQALMDFLTPPEPEPEPEPEQDEDQEQQDGDGEPEQGEPEPEQDEQDEQDDDADQDDEPEDDEGEEIPDDVPMPDIDQPDDEPEPGEGEGEGDEPGEGQGEGEGDDEGDEPEGEPEMVPVDLTDDPMDKMVDESLETPELDESLGDESAGNGQGEALEALERENIQLTEKPLTRKLPVSKLRHRTNVPADRGRVPKYMGRYCTDRAVFSSKGKRQIRGGTILIDCSTHMGLTDEILDRLMAVAPTARIATYVACNVSNRGLLWVIAENGRRTNEKLVPSLGCSCANGADVAALTWVAAFKDDGPLFWLCKDGEYVGDSVKRRRDEIVRKNDIRRLESIEDLIAAIKRGR